MPVAKFLQHDGNGSFSEILGAQLGGSGYEGKIVALSTTAGLLDATMLPSGIGAATTSIATSESLSAGDIVNIYNDAGTPKARKANAVDANKPACGFVLAGVTSPSNAVVYTDGLITGLSALVPGTRRYLSESTPGLTTATPPTGAGQVVAGVGRAVTATTMMFFPDTPILLA